jgi:hypothetical protein
MMSAPGKAGACQPDNPARSKASHQTGTELCAQGGNELREAIGRETVGHNASEGIEPRNIQRCTGPRVSLPGSQKRGSRDGEAVTPCRGLRPWQGVERCASEPGRAMPLSMSRRQAEEARKRYGGMAVGPGHSRGVVVVMRGEDTGSTRRGRQQDAEGKGSKCQTQKWAQHLRS